MSAEGGEKMDDGGMGERGGQKAAKSASAEKGGPGKARVSFTEPDAKAEGPPRLSREEFAAKRERMEAERAAAFLDAKRRERKEAETRAELARASQSADEEPPAKERTEEELVLAGHRLLSALVTDGRGGAALLGPDGSPALLLKYLRLLIRMGSDTSAILHSVLRRQFPSPDPNLAVSTSSPSAKS